MRRQGLQITLSVIGAAASVFGVLGVTKGASGVLDGGPVSANVDSELRFFASWYAVAGGLMLNAARRPESETAIVRAAGIGFLLAACGRSLSRRALGRPHGLFRTLHAIELAIPVVIVPWQRSVRAAHARSHASR